MATELPVVGGLAALYQRATPEWAHRAPPRAAGFGLILAPDEVARGRALTPGWGTNRAGGAPPPDQLPAPFAAVVQLFPARARACRMARRAVQEQYIRVAKSGYDELLACQPTAAGL